MDESIKKLIQEYKEKYDPEFELSWFKRPAKIKEHAKSLINLESSVDMHNFTSIVRLSNFGQLKMFRRILSDYIIWESDDKVWKDIEKFISNSLNEVGNDYDVWQYGSSLFVKVEGEWLEITQPIEKRYR